MENNNVIKHIIFKLMIISIFFDAYAITYIGRFPVTIFVIVSAVYIVFSIFNIFKHKSLIVCKHQLTAGIMILYLFVNFLLSGAENITAMLLGIFYFFIFLIDRRFVTEKYYYEYISLFQKMMNVMAIYGIYQLFARVYGFPFGDLIIQGHMVEGFNWSNQIYILGMHIYRSNAVFREPSFFSQYLAINILIYFSKILRENTTNNVKNIICLIINIVALIFSFSGTGIMLLLFSVFLYVIKTQKSTRIRRRLLLYSGLAILTILCLLNTEIGEHFLNRASELFTYRENASSGYVRIRSGVDILEEAWGKNPIFGIGIGNVQEFIISLPNYYYNMTVNGFYRPAVELGIIGLILWIVFLLQGIQKNTLIDIVIALQCVLFPMIFCHEAFMSNYYWIIWYLVNTNISENSGVNVSNYQYV